MESHTKEVPHGIPAGNGSGDRPYKVRPLKGQVLVHLSPPEYQTHGGLVLPDIALFSPQGEKERPRKATVIAVGEWRKTKQGFAIVPDIHPGQRVIVSEYFGTKLTRNIGEEYRLCRIDDVLAIVETVLTAEPSMA